MRYCILMITDYGSYFQFIRYLESLKGDTTDKIRNVYERACTIHHTKKPNLHLHWAVFEESHRKLFIHSVATSEFFHDLVKNYKIWERKRKTLTENWKGLWRKGTHKHTETYSKYLDDHSYLSQSKKRKCMWTHSKDGVAREFLKGAARGLWERKVWGEEGWRENYMEIIWG